MPSKAEKVPRLSWIGRQKKCIFLAFSDSFSHRLIHGNIAHLKTKVQKGYNYNKCIQIILTNQHFKTNQHLTDPILQESSTCILELLSIQPFRILFQERSYFRFNCATFCYHGLFPMFIPQIDSESMLTKGSAIETKVVCFLRYSEHQSLNFRFCSATP